MLKNKLKYTSMKLGINNVYAQINRKSLNKKQNNKEEKRKVKLFRLSKKFYKSLFNLRYLYQVVHWCQAKK